MVPRKPTMVPSKIPILNRSLKPRPIASAELVAATATLLLTAVLPMLLALARELFIC